MREKLYNLQEFFSYDLKPKRFEAFKGKNEYPKRIEEFKGKKLVVQVLSGFLRLHVSIVCLVY